MGRELVVVMREVWDTRDLTGAVLNEHGEIRADTVPTRVEPEDLNALEAALRLQDRDGVAVHVLGIGAPRNVDAPREALYRGANSAERIEADPEQLDTATQAALLAAAIRRRSPPPALVLVGTAVPDSDNSLLARHIAGELGWPAVSWVDSIEEFHSDRVVVRRSVEMGNEFLELPLPCVVAIGVALLEDDPRAPRPAKAMLKLKMKKTEIPSLTPASLGVSDLGSRTTTLRVRRESVPARVIETRTVDPEDEAALRAMLEAVRKGE